MNLRLLGPDISTPLRHARHSCRRTNARRKHHHDFHFEEPFHLIWRYQAKGELDAPEDEI
jgi:hypothetical protein